MSCEPVCPQNARILVVEDDPNNRLVLTRLLMMAGIRPENITECDSDPFVTIPIEIMDFNLIFLDLQLPKKDGYTILSELKSIPSLSRTKIIAITANVMKQDVERARISGFDGFIGKPVDGRKFIDTISNMLSGIPIWILQ